MNVDLVELKSQIRLELEKVESRHKRLLEQLGHMHVVRDLAAAIRVSKLSLLRDYGRFVLQDNSGSLQGGKSRRNT